MLMHLPVWQLTGPLRWERKQAKFHVVKNYQADRLNFIDYLNPLKCRQDLLIVLCCFVARTEEKKGKAFTINRRYDTVGAPPPFKCPS